MLISCQRTPLLSPGAHLHPLLGLSHQAWLLVPTLDLENGFMRHWSIWVLYGLTESSRQSWEVESVTWPRPRGW